MELVGTSREMLRFLCIGDWSNSVNRAKMPPQIKTRFPDRTFSSPVALAFVRSVVAHRGISEAQARKVYLDYLNRSKPSADAKRRKVT